MPALNLDGPEPAIANAGDGSALFPQAPVYARTSTRKKKSSSNLPLLIGAPVAVVAVGALAWGVMSNQAQAPASSGESLQVAQAEPVATPAPTPAPMPEPAAAMPAPTPAARVETARAEPRPAVRRAARPAPVETAPSADEASSNVSATVPAPTPAPAPAAPAAIVAEPAPLAVPAPTPAPAPQAPVPVVPVTPNTPQ